MQLPARLFSPRHIVGFLMRLWKEILNSVKMVALKSFEKNSNFVTAESLSLKVKFY